jgi:3D (Asp-Asp-Asp) domain-containing protein
MKRFLSKMVPVIVLSAIIVFFFSNCHTPIRPPRGSKMVVRTLEVTGYDAGPESCGWKRNWYGRPVYAYGPNKGKPKKVGITASGTKARKGTLAADTRYYPFGTVMYIPGYGYGRVEDRGGAIKGHKVDLFFRSRKDALKWGRKKKKVKVWLP